MPELDYITLYGCPTLENPSSLKIKPGVMQIYDEEGREEGVSDLNPFNGIDLSDSDGELYYSNQEHETELERVEDDQPQSVEEQPQSVEKDQPPSEEKVKEKPQLQAALFFLPWSCPWAC